MPLKRVPLFGRANEKSHSKSRVLILHPGCPAKETQGSKRHKLNHGVPCYGSSSVTRSAEKVGDVTPVMKIKARLRALEIERDTHRRPLNALEEEKSIHERALEALEEE